MTKVVGVRFKKMGKVYYFDPQELELEEGLVVVETAGGIECGELVFTQKQIDDEKITSQLKKVIRQATPADEDRLREREGKKREALQICEEKIAAHKLEMKLIDVEIAFDGSKITFFFTADGRVDFRELVKDLAHVFRTRIELRQIGVRDETKMLGGIGACGRVCCCTAFLSEFAPVSIKMAKEQNLSLNPTKISGLCGRLMCCLKYEQNYYEQMRREMPRVGREIATPDGPGTLMENNVLKKTCRVRITLPDQTVDMRTYSLEDIRRAEAGLPPLSQEAQRDEEGMPVAVLVSERRAPRPQQNGQNRPPQNRGEQQERQNRDGRAPAQGRQQNRRRRPQNEGGQNASANAKETAPQRQNRPSRPRQQQSGQNPQTESGNRENAPRRGQNGQRRQSGQNRPQRSRNPENKNAANEAVTLRPAGETQKGGAPRPRNNNARRRSRSNNARRTEGQETVRLVPATAKKED